MKWKKEFAILFFIIVVLVFYITSEKREKTHYELPEVQKIEKSAISELHIRKKGADVVLRKEDKKWLVGAQKYPADESGVDNILDGVTGLTLTTLISESKNYSLYELDEDSRIVVEALIGEDVVRKITVGKPAPSYRHTFVMLDDDYRVYHAEGNLKNEFDKMVPDLRDKQVMAISDEIVEITLNMGANELIITKETAPVSVEITEQEKQEEQAAEAPAPKWITSSGKPVKQKEVEEIVHTLSNLQCDGYIEGKTIEDYTSPVFSATLKGINAYSISLFEKKDNQYPAVSSENQYPFLISEWKAKRLMKDLKGLVEEEE